MTNPNDGHLTLIVTRIKPGAEPELRRLFTESDESGLPEQIGLRSRRLLTFQDLYFHLMTSDQPLGERLSEFRDNAELAAVTKAADAWVEPYNGAWGSLEAVQARQFYQWDRPNPLTGANGNGHGAHMTMIVARTDERHRPRIAELFADSDQTELPDLVGVTRRRLFTFHDVYMHLVETNAALATTLTPQHDNPLFKEVSVALDEVITPYNGAWGSVEQASARQFYHWERERGVVEGAA